MSTAPIDLSEATIQTTAIEVAKNGGFNYDTLQPLAQLNIREQTRQVLAAYNKTLKEQTA